MAQGNTAWRRFYRFSNSRVRLGVGLVLAALFCIQCYQGEPPTAGVLVADAANDVNMDAQANQLAQLARTDHVALLKLALKRYDESVQSYTCTFIKQERINGSLKPEQWVKTKFLEKPFSVAMHCVKNPQTGDRALFVAGKHNGQMLIHLYGLLAMFGTVTRDPESPQVMANTLRPITRFGFRRSLQALLDVYEPAARRGDLKQSFGGYRNLAGRRVLVLERLLPPKDDYPAYKTVVYLDTAWLMPLGVEAYDWENQLTCRYLYKDVDFNASLSEKDFTPQANGMKLPQK